jgi:8-oxo-dGTP pyrophosphatase MutT (NUDIX family)
MDATFKTDRGKFNYRVAAIITDGNRLLVTYRDGEPYLHLPGGRVMVGEPAELAILREIKEELGVESKINRPLWLNQAFFTEDSEHIQFHELCLYFLLDISNTDLMDRDQQFTTYEGDKIHKYKWIEFDDLYKETIYPSFLKYEISNLPQGFTLKTEYQ